MDKTTPTRKTPQLGLLPQLRRLAGGAQFYWYLTLVSTLWFTLLCVFSSMFRGASRPSTVQYYSHALLSILITYLIILRQTYKNKPVAYFIGQLWNLVDKHRAAEETNKKQESSAKDTTSNSANTTTTNTSAGTDVNKSNSTTNNNKKTLLRDENVQYLLFAFCHWLFASTAFGAINPSTLYPFAIYGLFHSSNYTQANIIPFIPFVTSQTKQRWCANIQHFHRLFNERSRIVAANTEVLLVTFYLGPLLKLLFRLALGRVSSLSLYDLKSVVLFLVTVTFLRARYDVDSYTRNQVQTYDTTINRLVWHPLLPEHVRQLLMGLRKVVGDFVEVLDVV